MLLYSNLYFSKLTGWFNSSSSANMFSCASSDLQKTHRKTKIQQKTSDKDIGQASGGKPKEQGAKT
jgi:hypothetical protein